MLKEFNMVDQVNFKLFLEMAKTGEVIKKPVNFDADDFDFLQQIYPESFWPIAYVKRYDLLYEEVQKKEVKRKELGIEELIKKVEKAIFDNEEESWQEVRNWRPNNPSGDFVNLRQFPEDRIQATRQNVKYAYFDGLDEASKIKTSEDSAKFQVYEWLKTFEKASLDIPDNQEIEMSLTVMPQSRTRSGEAGEDFVGKRIFKVKPFLNRLYEKLELTAGKFHSERYRDILGQVAKYGYDMTAPTLVTRKSRNAGDQKKGEEHISGKKTAGMVFPELTAIKSRFRDFLTLSEQRVFASSETSEEVLKNKSWRAVPGFLSSFVQKLIDEKYKELKRNRIFEQDPYEKVSAFNERMKKEAKKIILKQIQNDKIFSAPVYGIEKYKDSRSFELDNTGKIEDQRIYLPLEDKTRTIFFKTSETSPLESEEVRFPVLSPATYLKRRDEVSIKIFQERILKQLYLVVIDNNQITKDKKKSAKSPELIQPLTDASKKLRNFFRKFYSLNKFDLNTFVEETNKFLKDPNVQVYANGKTFEECMQKYNANLSAKSSTKIDIFSTQQKINELKAQTESQKQFQRLLRQVIFDKFIELFKFNTRKEETAVKERLNSLISKQKIENFDDQYFQEELDAIKDGFENLVDLDAWNNQIQDLSKDKRKNSPSFFKQVNQLRFRHQQENNRVVGYYRDYIYVPFEEFKKGSTLASAAHNATQSLVTSTYYDISEADYSVRLRNIFPALVKQKITNISVSQDGLCIITSPQHNLKKDDEIQIMNSNSVPSVDTKYIDIQNSAKEKTPKQKKNVSADKNYWTVKKILDENQFMIEAPDVQQAGTEGFFSLLDEKDFLAVLILDKNEKKASIFRLEQSQQPSNPDLIVLTGMHSILEGIKRCYLGEGTCQQVFDSWKRLKDQDDAIHKMYNAVLRKFLDSLGDDSLKKFDNKVKKAHFHMGSLLQNSWNNFVREEDNLNNVLVNRLQRTPVSRPTRQTGMASTQRKRILSAQKTKNNFSKFIADYFEVLKYSFLEQLEDEESEAEFEESINADYSELQQEVSDELDKIFENYQRLTFQEFDSSKVENLKQDLLQILEEEFGGQALKSYIEDLNVFKENIDTFITVDLNAAIQEYQKLFGSKTSTTGKPSQQKPQQTTTTQLPSTNTLDQLILKKIQDFATNPNKEAWSIFLNDYISSLTTLNKNNYTNLLKGVERIQNLKDFYKSSLSAVRNISELSSPANKQAFQDNNEVYIKIIFRKIFISRKALKPFFRPEHQEIRNLFKISANQLNEYIVLIWQVFQKLPLQNCESLAKDLSQIETDGTTTFQDFKGALQKMISLKRAQEKK